MNYGEILEKAARILWRFKILWIFGLFSSCAGSGAGVSSNFRYSISSAEINSLPAPLRGPLAGIIALLQSIPPLGWFLILVLFLCLLVFLTVLGVVGRTGMVRGAWLADAGRERLAFGDLLRQSGGYFWRVLAVNILMGLPGLAFFMIGLFGFVLALIPAISRNTPGPILILLCALIPCICLAIPLFMLLGALGELSSIAVIGEDRGVFSGIQRGWEVLRRNLGPVIIVGLILYVGTLIAGWVIGIPAIFFTIPLLGSAVVGSAGLMSLTTLVFAIFYLPLVLLCNSLLQVFLESAWTLAFRRMTAVPPPPAAEPPPAAPEAGFVIPPPPPL